MEDMFMFMFMFIDGGEEREGKEWMGFGLNKGR